MKPVDQDVNLAVGNCWSACMASILMWPWERFRDFHQEFSRAHRDLKDAEYEERVAYMRILHRLGYHVQRVEFGELEIVPAGYSIASGMADRGVMHSCVAMNGEIVHDPHPSRAGLHAIDYYEVLVRLAPRP